MRWKVRRKFRIILRMTMWMGVLVLGISIMAKGSRLVYGKAFLEVVGSSLSSMFEGLGIDTLEKYEATFSYFMSATKEQDNPGWIFDEVNLWAKGMYQNGTAYPIEDGQYVGILSEIINENENYNESSTIEGISIVSHLPVNITEADKDSEDKEDDNKENTEDKEEAAAVPTISPVAPAVIGTIYNRAQLSDFDFLIRKFYAVELNTTVNNQILNVSNMLDKDMSLEINEKKTPQILIYHTHASEAYKDSRPGVTEDTVVGMGEYLATILERDYGYEVLHVTTAFDSLNGEIDRSMAYAYAEGALDGILATYPDIEVIIDLHRDGVNEDVHLVTEYNGKKAAKIMFVNGISRLENESISYLYNPYIADNLAFSFQLQLKGEAYFPNLMRRIIIKAYRYNLHYEPRSVLVELGAQTNTVEEARNSVELLAVMLGEVLK